MSEQHDTDSRITMKGSLAMRVFITSCAFIVIPLIFYTAFTYKSEYDRALNQVYDSLDISLDDQTKYISDVTDLQINFLDALYQIIQEQKAEDLSSTLSSFFGGSSKNSILYLKNENGSVICFASNISDLVGKNFSGQIDLKKIDLLKRNAFIAKDANGVFSLYLVRLIKDEKLDEVSGAVALTLPVADFLSEVSEFSNLDYIQTTILSFSGDVLASTDSSWVGRTWVVRSTDELNLGTQVPEITTTNAVFLDKSPRGFELQGENSIRLVVMQKLGKLPLMIALDVPKNVFLNQLKNYITSLGSLFLFILFVGGAATYILTLRISKPLSNLCSVMKLGEEGKLDARYGFDTWGFEVNLVGNLYNRLMDKIESMILEIRAERTEKERYANQMLLALEIQKSLLPTKYQMPKLKIASSYFPAIDVAGDIFDCFELSGDRVLLMCSDVAGKGIQACLYSLGFRGFLRSVSLFESDLAKIVNQVNQLYLKDTEENSMFVTAWIGILDTKTRVLEYVSMGHPPALLRRHDQPVQLLEGEGIPFGIQPLDQVITKKITLEPKDIVIAYTDGVTEATNDEKKLFGMQRLIDCVRNIDVATPQNLINDMYRRIKEFSSKEQSDDITILVVEIE
jgi:sigma-B regulation protein RsbU (phosphoserine phosphatase)